MPEPVIPRIGLSAIQRRAAGAVSRETLSQAAEIVDAVRDRGEPALRDFAARFGERSEHQPLVLGRDAMQEALPRVDPQTRAAIERAAGRIRGFAQAQASTLRALTVPVPGGEAGHTIEPVESAGCYAPAGRHPLPSSVLMTAVPARVSGADRVVVCTPGAGDLTLAAAAIAGADEVLSVGGAHGVSALAHGFDGFQPVDFIAGPGNRWVTAAKQLVSGVCGIDMLAGPSELLIIADHTADPATIAADLLAQAEHDTDAAAMLITTCPNLADAVPDELNRQLATLNTSDVARAGLKNGFIAVAPDADAMIAAADTVAAEHLEVVTENAASVAARVRHAGATFIGHLTAEAIGDYGIGPNHTLPTGGTARFTAGLSVLSFLRVRTWIRLDDSHAAEPVMRDTAVLARAEGLDAHAASAERRIP